MRSFLLVDHAPESKGQFDSNWENHALLTSMECSRLARANRLKFRLAAFELRACCDLDKNDHVRSDVGNFLSSFALFFGFRRKSCSDAPVV